MLFSTFCLAWRNLMKKVDLPYLIVAIIFYAFVGVIIGVGLAMAATPVLVAWLLFSNLSQLAFGMWDNPSHMPDLVGWILATTLFIWAAIQWVLGTRWPLSLVAEKAERKEERYRKYFRRATDYLSSKDWTTAAFLWIAGAIGLLSAAQGMVVVGIAIAISAGMVGVTMPRLRCQLKVIAAHPPTDR
jgi:hypothetical protein